MVIRPNRLRTDAWREIRHTFSRFLSLVILSALAVAFLVGLRAAAPHMEYTADQYYDETHLMDGYVLSTMGLTDEDLDALAAAPGVAQVEGGWNLDAIAIDSVVTVRSLPEQLNQLTVTEGRLPRSEDECVTETLLLESLGLSVGDTLELTAAEDEEEDLSCWSYTVVGTVTSPLYVGTDRGTSRLGNGAVDGFVYVPADNFQMDVYTVAYFTSQGLADLESYSDEYDDRAEALLDSLEPLSEERAALRDDVVRQEAQEELDDAQRDIDEAQEELDDAKAKLEQARAELDAGWQQYYDGLSQLTTSITDGRAQLEETAATLVNSWQEYYDGQAQYEAALADYEAQAAQLTAAEQELEQGQAQYEAALAPYVGTPQYALVEQQLAPQKAQLDETAATLAEARKQLDAGKAQLDETAATLTETHAQLTAGQAQYDEALAELNRQQLAGQAQLSGSLAKLDEGETAYARSLGQYAAAVAEAEPELKDARQELEDGQQELDEMEPCEWYVLGRDGNAGIVGYSQDAQRVANLAAVFPVIFFVVAALACLTTMTRMVEEQRAQIGALKALGFTRMAISWKYLGYAAAASCTGGLAGLALGATLIPAVIANAFAIMYTIPALQYKSLPVLYTLSVLLAVVCTTGASLWACFATLMDTPANLMRPRAPKPGRRVFLEYCTPIWRRLSFTWKVTMRNLFRYQRRFWMTVLDIGGCTALIVTGFGLHDSIFAILDNQYDEICVYDTLVGIDADLSQGQRKKITTYLDGSDAVADYLFTSQESLDVSAGGVSYGATLFAVSDGDAFSRFIRLRDRQTGKALSLSDQGVVLSEKTAELLEVEPGDHVLLDGDKRVEVTVAALTENYVQHYVYLTVELYEQLFGQPPEENTILLTYGPQVDDVASDDTTTELMTMEGVTSCSYIATMRDLFTDSMSAVNYAVVIIIVAAAVLAFVVLYNLTNINITERIRELATLKVLGFYDREVTAYVYRENAFLTLFGIGLGLVMGRWLHSWMVLTVEIDMVMFGRTAPPYAYGLAAAMTVVFSLVVNLAAHYKLKTVDMVESLKSVE